MRRNWIKIAICVALLLVVSVPIVPAQAQTATPEGAVVHAVLFWKAGCHFCEQVLTTVIPPIQERYGVQFDLLLIQIVTQQDANNFFRLAASVDIPRHLAGIPFLLIGDRVLMGPPTISSQLPGLIDQHLAQGGLLLPDNPILAEIIAGLPVSDPGTIIYPPPTVTAAPSATGGTGMKDNGFLLAELVILLIALALAYFVTALIIPRLPVPRGSWAEPAILLLLLAGIGVAGYLSYVELTATPAICGTVGDCNTVQTSPYARLFGVLPVGVLGMIGDLLLLAALAVRRFVPRLRSLASFAFCGMSIIGAGYSLHLTYLERHVIHAVCIWCISSAIIMTLILLLGLAFVRETNNPKRKEISDV